MNLKTALLGMMFAFGVGIGVNASATNTSMYACCMAKQELCEDAYGKFRCRNVYENCMLSNNCNTAPY